MSAEGSRRRNTFLACKENNFKTMLMERRGRGRNNTAIYFETITFGTVLDINFAIIPSCLNYACNVVEIDCSGKGAYEEKIGKTYFLLYA